MKTILVSALGLWILAAVARGDDREVAKQPPTEKATKLAKELRANVATFRLDLTYYGPAVKEQATHYNVTLSVPPVEEQLAKDPSHVIVLIKEAQAETIIGWLETDGFFDRSIDDMKQDITLRAPKGPTYWLTIRHAVPNFGTSSRHEDLGWNLQTLKRLDSLKLVLDKEPAAALDLLLDRMADERRLWEAK